MAGPVSQDNQKQPTKFSPEDLDKFGPFVARVGEILARSIMWWKLRSIHKRERERLPEREKLIAVIRQQHKKAIERGMHHYERVFNVGLYVMILDYDFSIISNYYSTAYRTWEKKFAARQLAVILYESAEDIPQLLGKDFRKTLSLLPLWNETIDELNVISKRLDTFNKTNQKHLKQLRTYVGAHRDSDAGKQLEIIDSIDPMAIYQLAANFYESIHPLTEFLIKVTSILARYDVTLTHLLKTPEFSKPPSVS